MDDARHGRAAAVVDVGHGAGDGSRGRNAAEERREEVGGTLRDELRVRVVAVAHHTVGHGGREQRFDGTEDGDRERRGEEAPHGLPVDLRQARCRQLGTDGEAVADGVDAFDAGVGAEQPDGEGHRDDGRERSRDAAHQLGREDDDEDTDDAHGRVPEPESAEVAEVERPFADEVSRDGFAAEVEPEEIGDLRGEDRNGDSGRESDDDRVGDELDDRAQPEGAHCDEQSARHERGDQQTRFAVLLDDAVDDDDEGARGAADLHAAAAQQRDDESGDHGRDDTLLGRDARGDAEGDGQRQGDDADDDAGHEIGGEIRARVVFQGLEQFGPEGECVHMSGVCLIAMFFEAAKIGKIIARCTPSDRRMGIAACSV